MAVALKSVETQVMIKAPNILTAEFVIKGTAPYMQHRFWKKAEMMAAHQAGQAGKNKKKKAPRDFDKDCRESMYETDDGKHGIPAPAFRQALISACRLVGFKMVLAKLSLFIESDAFDHRDGTPLVFIEGKPAQSVMPVRNDTGVIDLRARPVWSKWSAKLRIRYDGDQFSLADVSNLLQRVGAQVGIGEGRPDSKNSAGLGYGLFEVQ